MLSSTWHHWLTSWTHTKSLVTMALALGGRSPWLRLHIVSTTTFMRDTLMIVYDALMIHDGLEHLSSFQHSCTLTWQSPHEQRADYSTERPLSAAALTHTSLLAFVPPFPPLSTPSHNFCTVLAWMCPQASLVTVPFHTTLISVLVFFCSKPPQPTDLSILSFPHQAKWVLINSSWLLPSPCLLHWFTYLFLFFFCSSHFQVIAPVLYAHLHRSLSINPGRSLSSFNCRPHSLSLSLPPSPQHAISSLPSSPFLPLLGYF